MTRRTGFGNDLEALTADVEADVAGMLHVLSDGRRGTKSSFKKQQGPNMENNAHSQANGFPSEVGSKKLNNSRRVSEPGSSRIEKSSTQSPVPLVNVTTRLTHAINELLTEASLRQRLKRAQPATRQEIIEQALHSWLSDNGYLGPC